MRVSDKPIDANTFSVASYDFIGHLSSQQGGSEEEFIEHLKTEAQALDADILCFQSINVEHWNLIESTLADLGWKGYKKNRRPGDKTICEAILYKESKFDVIGRWSLFLDEMIVKQSRSYGEDYHPDIKESVESPEVVLLVILRCKTSQRNFWVANTRCASQQRNRPDLQASQICSVLKELTMLYPGLPVVFSGNFEFQPNHGQYQIVRKGSMTLAIAESFEKIKSIIITADEKYPLSIIYGIGFKHPVTSLRSAYEAALGFEPPNYWRKDNDSLSCSSYIWFNEAQLTIKAVLNVITSQLQKDTSDSNSVALKAVFQFRDDNPRPEDV